MSDLCPCGGTGVIEGTGPSLEHPGDPEEPCPCDHGGNVALASAEREVPRGNPA